MKAGSQGRHVGVLTLTIDRVEGRGGADQGRLDPEFRLRSTAATEGDATLAAKVRGYQAGLDETLDVVIGETATELRHAAASCAAPPRPPSATCWPTPCARPRAPTSRSATAAASGATRSTRPARKLTRKMVLTELPFGNKTVVLRLTGAQVREALENGVSRAAHPSGRFPQVSGLAFTFDARRPPGERVTQRHGGRRAAGGRQDLHARHQQLPRANGGDDYRVFKAAEVLVDSASGSLMAGQLIDHIIAAGTVSRRRSRGGSRARTERQRTLREGIADRWVSRHGRAAPTTTNDLPPTRSTRR